ncbi:hypothetical protein C8R44DRAFT_892497 [Mycena epipterygia]|nr:hypothetical protein C8R44DRAFT_892497 [Mycena epipterygia]
MHCSNFRSDAPTGLHFKKSFSDMSTQDDHTADTLLDSATTLLEIAREEPKKSWQTASSILRVSSFMFHSLLVAIHLALVGIWARELEHHVTVGLDNQQFASFLITATTTAVGTIYSALLVFVTQTLSMRRSLQIDQVLTATHDTAAAWAGIGAAISHLWNQKVVHAGRASIFGVLCATMYLSAIVGLHITTSSLFSLGTFNATRSSRVGTHGLPAFNSTPDSSALSDMKDYAAGSLYFLPAIFNSTTSVGLHQGTLYDVLDSNVPSGNATVAATSFNISCGSLPDTPPLVLGEPSPLIQKWSSRRGSGSLKICSTQPGIISIAGLFDNHSITLYSTIPIIDSNGNNGSWADLIPSMNTSVSSVQIFQCSLSLLKQTAGVDAQSRQIYSVKPDLKKTASTWMPYTEPSTLDDNAPTTGNSLIDMWGMWYALIPPASRFVLDATAVPTTVMASVTDIYLIQKLNLPAANLSDTLNVTLHDVENALSTVVASVFWTCHIPPTYRTLTDGDDWVKHDNGTTGIAISELPNPPILLPGNATLDEIYIEARLELSIIAVSAGLTISLTLMFLALLLQRGSKYDTDSPIDGTGILHAIWLYRHHPELETLLEQVEHPTDDQLREAGMVRTRLIGGRLRKQRGELF